MKKIFTTFCVTVIVLVANIPIRAYVGDTFTYDSFRFKILSETAKTVSLTDGKNESTVKIPSEVHFNNVTYSVTSIWTSAFKECIALTTVEIPNSVTSIGEFAFYGCTGLTSVEIPNSVTSIGEFAFCSCTSLTNVEIPNSVTSIGKETFYGCSALKSVEIPNSVTSIGKETFYGCSALKSVEIPNSVTSIGNSAFYGCSTLTSVDIPNSVTSIGNHAFYSCSALTSVVIPNSVTSIAEYTFAYCFALKSVEIPNSVTSIAEYTFAFCSALTSVEIPNSVTSIGDHAFYIGNLKKINCQALTPPVINENTFSNYSAKVQVPEESLDAYKNANYWKNFFMSDIGEGEGGGGSGSEDESLSVYLGIIGFNGKLFEKPIALLTSNVVDEYTSWVNDLKLDRNTLLYYSVESAINKFALYNFKEKLSNAAIITFTDGLDQGSLAMNTNMTTDQQYLNYLKNKISSTKIQDINLKAYTIGVEGVDVMDQNLFRNNLESLASAPENAYRISNLSQIDDKFNLIYNDLNKQRNQLILTISVPLMSDGTVCRFTLDGASSAETSKVWLQGTFNRSTLRLTDIQYHGLSSSAGTGVKAIMDGLNIVFTFEDCRDIYGNILSISRKSDIDQWTYIPSSGKWQHNVEIADSDIDLEKRFTTAVMLLIDCSSSLGSKDFEKLKKTANTFIERLIDLDGIYNSIESIYDDEENYDDNIDWNEAEFYNLQGIKVANPSSGIYIQRIGNHTRKILIK